MFSTATPKWLLAAGLAGLVAAPATAQSSSRVDVSPSALSASATPAQSPNVKYLRGGGFLQDPSFEEGGPNPFWLTNTPSYLSGSPVFGPPRAGGQFDFARTGTWYAILGSGGPTASDVYQDVEVTEVGEQTLGFYLFTGINEGSQSVLRVFIDDEELDLIDAAEAANYGSYTLLEYPYTFEETGTYRVRFEQTQPTQGAAFINWFIDDVSLGTPPPPPTGNDFVTQATEIASLGVYADGNFGTDPSIDFDGPGFVFNGVQPGGAALFSSTFAAGTSPAALSGSAYDENSDWVAEQLVTEIEAPSGFTSAYEAIYTDANAESPLGLRVTQRTYADSLADDVNAGIVVEFTIENASADDIEDLYAGIFADWDVGTGTDYEQNLADFYQSGLVGLNHVWLQGGGSNSNYYGVALLNKQASGYAFDQAGNVNDGEIWEGLTEMAVTPDSPGDRRTTTGSGPYDLSAGESVTVRFAYVAGTDANDIIENAEAIALRFFDGTLSNDLISIQGFGNGVFGADAGSGSGFVFDGANGLYDGRLIIATAEDNVYGNPYITGDYETVLPLRPVAAPAGFSSAARSVFASADGAVEVLEEIFVPNSFAFAIIRYTIENTSGAAIDEMYVGPFADWDAGDYEENVGGYDAASRLLYVSDNSDADTDFFGIAARDANVSGYDFALTATSSGIAESVLYDGLTTMGEVPSTPQDLRTILGNGPYALAPGEMVTVSYAVVGGETQAEIQTTATLALTAPLPPVPSTDAEEPAEELELAKTGLRVFPNPVASQATVAFRAPVGADARVAVYDVLGREVLRVADQAATSAEQRVQFSTSSLPAGLYLVRLTAGGTSAVQQITVVR